MVYITPPQLGKRLGVSPDKVRGWIRRGELVAINVSDGDRAKWRIHPDAAEAFIAARSSTPAATVTPRRKRQSVREFF